MTFSDRQLLCIDDDAHTSNWIRIMLKGAKIDAAVTVAKTGSEAFRLLNNEDFDLCILEYALPDMTGVQFCSLVRQMGSDMPMMFFTAMNRSVDHEKAAAAGANAYLCKPNDFAIFVRAVTNLLKERPPVYLEKTKLSALPKAA